MIMNLYQPICLVHFLRQSTPEWHALICLIPSKQATLLGSSLLEVDLFLLPSKTSGMLFLKTSAASLLSLENFLVQGSLWLLVVFWFYFARLSSCVGFRENRCVVHFLIILQYYHHLFYLQLFFIFLCLSILLYIISLSLFYITFYYLIKDVKRLEIIVLSTILLSVKQINYILLILII